MYKIFNHDSLNQINKKTPFYLYDKDLLVDTLKSAQDFASYYLKHKFCLHYALKANDNPELLRVIHHNNFGVDCVSGGEVKKALNTGFNPEKIVFAGVGKTDSEIRYALKNNIYAFNTESIQEIEVINKIAKSLNLMAKIMIRVNPDINAKTHKHISTGRYDNKFGITFDDALNFLSTRYMSSKQNPESICIDKVNHTLNKINNFKNIDFIGLHYHIGSQITDMGVFKELALKINYHYKKLKNLGVNITDLNIGGGLGVNYQDPSQEPIADFSSYFKTIAMNLDIPTQIKLHFELGRSIIAQCGALVSQVIFTKNTAGTNFAIIDAGMNDLMRPALYSAKHKIEKIGNTKSKIILKYHIVGPVCESTDVFAKNLKIQKLERGDKIVIYTAGAYGAVLANEYNSRAKIKEFF